MPRFSRSASLRNLRAVVEQHPGDECADDHNGGRVGGDDEVDVIALPASSARGVGLHQPQRPHAAAQDFVAHGGEKQA